MHLKKEFNADTELLLRYIENQLTTIERIELEARLQNDPALRNELEIYRKTILQSDSEQFPKTLLLKTDDDLILNSPVLNFIEQQVDPQEHELFLKALSQHPQLQNEVIAFESTRLTADLSVTYPNKESLYKQARVIPLFKVQTWKFSAAAVFVITLLGFLFFPSLQDDGQKPALANLEAISKDNTPAAIQEERPKINETSIALANTVERSPSRDKQDSLPLKSEVPSKLTEVQVVQSPESLVVALPETESLLPPKPIAADPTETAQKFASVDELELTDDLPEFDFKEEKTNLWHKAVDVAKRFNKMGFTAVNGEEERRTRSYRLSFNSFSVEKK